MQLSPGMIYIDLTIYTIIFILCIPAFLFKYKYFTFLEAYMPNLDLIATILTFNKLSFNKLYLSDPTTIHEEISQSYVNYFALLGVGYLIIKQALNKRNVYYGLAMGAIMILMTYISPSLYLSNSMQVIENKSNNIIATIVGIVMVACLILIEKEVIDYLQKPLSKVIELIVSFKWLF